MKKLLKGFLAVCLLMTSVVGCESGDCMLSSESYCSISFVDAQGKGVKLQDSLTVSAMPNIVIINRKLGASGMDLPLSYTAVVDTFVMRYSARLADTLWLEHQNHPYFSSMECGTVMHYKLMNIRSTSNLIDSVQIVNPEVTNTLKDNVKIYFTVNN